MTDSTVVSLADAGIYDLNDIPARMEGMAALVRAGEYGETESGVCVLINKEGELTVCGWGRTYDIHSVGLLSLGIQFLAANRTKR